MAVSATRGAGQRSGHDGLLEFIRRAGQTTRKAVAEYSGLSRSVVAQAVAELIAQGVVVERKISGEANRPTAHARRGRPTAVLELAHQPGVVVACDIGHRHLTVAVSDLRSRVRAEQRLAIDVDEGAAATFRALHRLIAAALVEAGSSITDVRALGVSFPFPVVAATGSVKAPAALAGWRGVNAADARPPGLVGPLVHDNDANFGAWGEHIDGASRELDNLLYVKLSDGIGSGLIVDGLLLSGSRGTGGEMGHIQVVPNGARCRCGRYGCLETVVAASLPDHRLAGLRVGRAIAELCAFVDAEVVILGGRLGASSDLLVEGVREAFARILPAAEPGETRIDVRPAALGARSELVGIIDRTVTAAWASGAVGADSRDDALSSCRRTNSRAAMEIPFDEERLVMKE